MATRVQNWTLDRNLDLFAADGYRSVTVTTVSNTMNINIPQLNEFLISQDMRIANGYGALKNKTFRIAHMGELTLDDINKLLAAIDDFVNA